LLRLPRVELLFLGRHEWVGIGIFLLWDSKVQTRTRNSDAFAANASLTPWLFQAPRARLISGSQRRKFQKCIQNWIEREREKKNHNEHPLLLCTVLSFHDWV
jgi:hypothetical protein